MASVMDSIYVFDLTSPKNVSVSADPDFGVNQSSAQVDRCSEGPLCVFSEVKLPEFIDVIS